MNHYKGLVRRTPLKSRVELCRKSGVWLRAPSKPMLAAQKRTGPPKSTTDRLAERSGGICERCTQARATEVHHKLGRRAGGTRDPRINWLSNLAHLCSPCHLWATVNRTQPGEDGWVVFSHECPRHKPALVGPAPGTWKTFDDQGGWIDHGPEQPDLGPCDCKGHILGCSIWETEPPACDCGAGMPVPQPTQDNAEEATR